MGGSRVVLKRWLTAVVLASALLLVLAGSGCGPNPPEDAVSGDDAEAAAIEWISQADNFAAWNDVLTDPDTPVTVTYEPDDPMTDDDVETPVWVVEVTSPEQPVDPTGPVSSVIVYVRMDGSVKGFEGSETP